MHAPWAPLVLLLERQAHPDVQGEYTRQALRVSGRRSAQKLFPDVWHLAIIFRVHCLIPGLYDVQRLLPIRSGGPGVHERAVHADLVAMNNKLPLILTEGRSLIGKPLVVPLHDAFFGTYPRIS